MISFRLLSLSFLCCSLLFGFLSTKIVGQQFPAQEEVSVQNQRDDFASASEALPLPDRSLTRKLEQAEQLAAAGRSNEAASMLGNILETADCSFFLPPNLLKTKPSSEEIPVEQDTLKADRNVSNPLKESTVNQTVFDYLVESLRQLPPEAMNSYILQYEPTAKRLLENAAASGNLDEVGKIARKYFPTESGAFAAFLVGSAQFERGDDAAAFVTLKKLKHLHPALPEALKLSLEQSLEAMSTQQRTMSAGIENSESGISESSWLEQIGWRIPSGSPSQNPKTHASVPILEQNWIVPLIDLPETLNQQDQNITTSLGNTYIPAAMPILVGNRLIARKIGKTVAIDVSSGKRLWLATESKVSPTDMGYVGLHSLNHPAGMEHIKRNEIADALSSDGERVFSIDGHTDYDLSNSDRQIVFNTAWNEDFQYEPGNTLTARDMKSGNILWQIGKFPRIQKILAAMPSRNIREQDQADQENRDKIEEVLESLLTDDEKALKGTCFLGVPLPIQDRLYVIGETDGVFNLLRLESQTGKMIDRQPFALVTNSAEDHRNRLAYQLFPSVSEGILICPTGNGVICALDAATLFPLWSFRYSEPVELSQSPFGRATTSETYSNIYVDQYIFNIYGWQASSIKIDEHRVLVAPPDQPVLYCLDLLSGKLHWKKTFSWQTALYVACVHDHKAFIMMPTHLLAVDLDTGKEVSYAGHKFPLFVKPTGQGVHSGNQYFIPLSDGTLLSADLTEGTLTRIDGSVQKFSQEQGSMVHDQTDSDIILSEITATTMKEDSSFQEPLVLGNLIGIQGRFFSMTPKEVSALDQKEPLERYAQSRLQMDANDPEAMSILGRVLKSEGRLADAVTAFRSALKRKPSDDTAHQLRQCLLEVIRNDYTAWSGASQELESLAESPEEYGAALFVQAEGILLAGRWDAFPALLEKVFAFVQDQPSLVPIDGVHSVRLHKALGSLIEQNIESRHVPDLKAFWERLAEQFFDRLSDPSYDPMKNVALPRFSYGQSPRWMQTHESLPADIQRLSMFVDIFRNTSSAAQAKHVQREAYEKRGLSIAWELQKDSQPLQDWTKLSPVADWEQGAVQVTDDLQSSDQNAAKSPIAAEGNHTDQAEIDLLVNQLVNNVKNAADSRIGTTPFYVPYLGLPNDEFSSSRFMLKHWGSDTFLFCCDSLGREQWRIALPASNNTSIDTDYPRYGSEYTSFIKGWNHYLIFVHGNSITAIDAISHEKKVLWSKVLDSTPLIWQHSDDRRQGFVQQQVGFSNHFPQNFLFVSPQVVCYSDIGGICGLDPLTGETLWTRKMPASYCSLLGDEENLFLLFNDQKHVVAVDPSSGRELASGHLPSVGSCGFGTNIVFTEHGQGNEWSLNVCDLRNLFDKRRRTLMIHQSQDGTLRSDIPYEKISGNLNESTLVQMLESDRFISTTHWETKTLLIYDLHTKKHLLPLDNKLLTFVPDGNLQTTQCHVEFVGNQFLVLFTKDTNIRQTSEPITRNGKTIQRTHQMIHSVPCAGIGSGWMMLFDSAGNPCWSEPVEIKNRCRLFDVPDSLPVMLFAVAATERDETGRPSYSTGLVGIDKRTGITRFSKGIMAAFQVSMKKFQITADMETQEIFYTTINAVPPRTVRFKFFHQ